MDLTVAICMYNAEQYIEETLECLMQQSRSDWKLLIVNDASTDSSADRVKQFFIRNPREYTMVNLPENGGLSAGRRYVEENADTRYILFVDADDCPMPTLVEKLYARISADDNLMAVGCHLSFMDSAGKPIGGGIFLGETTKEGFYEKASKEKLIFMQPTAVYDRHVALRVGGHAVDGFPEGKPRYRDLCEDLDLWTRMSDLYSEGKAIVVVPEVLCRYRKHEKAMSTNSIGMALRMKHIKKNLKRRRRGEKELSFVEYRESLSDEEFDDIRRSAMAADALRRGYYELRKGHIGKGISQLIRCVRNKPGYLWDKVKHNLLRIK